MTSTRFALDPTISVSSDSTMVRRGWPEVCERILQHSAGHIAIETYQGVDHQRLIAEIKRHNHADALEVHDTRSLMKSTPAVAAMVQPDVTDDELFGFMTRLNLADFYPAELDTATLRSRASGRRLVLVGPGATIALPEASTLVYADMPRWEIQQRQRAGLVSSLGMDNHRSPPKVLYKQSYFVDWRVLDRHKKLVLPHTHLYLETVDNDLPAILTTPDLLSALQHVANRPFELKPFFDAGVWGGQWLKRVLGIKEEAPNYAWGFNCVPEENSLLLGFGKQIIEIPAINLVYFQTRKLLGDPVHARFGDEFPIRFDFLDTMEGQNLSFQVHPLTEYIREHFGISYTQDESYYILQAARDAVVYLGLRDSVSSSAMRQELEAAQRGEAPFAAESHVQTWPARQHDHFLIPAGTPHCSGSNCVVLEISATPYIFTFKLWDWNRVDLDGLPRPINIGRGWPNIRWERTTEWTRQNLINRIHEIGSGDGWREERTGLHELEFIETRRHWFSRTVEHNTGGMEKGSVHVLNLVEGEQATIESPDAGFEPFTVHYAETFVIPAAIGPYRVRPSGPSEDRTIATIRASVRTGINCDA